MGIKTKNGGVRKMDTEEQIIKYATTALVVVVIVLALFNWDTARAWMHVPPLEESE